jgi:hypothetical protein
LGQVLGPGYVPPLACLVATAEQDDDDIAAPDKIDRISRSVIDLKFADARSDRLDVSGLPRANLSILATIRARACLSFKPSSQRENCSVS